MHIEKWKTDKVMKLKTVRIDIYKVMAFLKIKLGRKNAKARLP